MISSESDCSCGSFSSSVPTSVSHWEVISLVSLCLAIGSPPEGYVVAWSVEKAFPHLQWWGTFFICHPYRKLSASRNSPLLKLKPWSFNGKTDNHDDEPFSPSRSIILCFGGDRLSLISWIALSVSCCFCRGKSVLIDYSCGLLNGLLYSTITSLSGTRIFCDSWYERRFVSRNPRTTDGRTRRTRQSGNIRVSEDVIITLIP